MGLIIVPEIREVLYHVALTGYPSCGKSEIGNVLSRRAGYRHVSTDMIRDELLGGKSVFELTKEDWDLLFSEFQTRKHLYLHDGKNVATDNCPLTNDERRVTMHVSPLFKEYLHERNGRLMRYLVVLDTRMEELARRNEQRGRTGEASYNMLKWLKGRWEEPPAVIADDSGEVPVLRYENNTPRDQQLVLKDLETRLGVTLL